MDPPLPVADSLSANSLSAAEMDMDAAALRERLRLRDQVVEMLKQDLGEREAAHAAEVARLEEIGEGLRGSIASGEARIASLTLELESRPTDAGVAQLEARVRTLQALVDSRDLGEWAATEGVPTEGVPTGGPPAKTATPSPRRSVGTAGSPTNSPRPNATRKTRTRNWKTPRRGRRRRRNAWRSATPPYARWSST